MNTTFTQNQNINKRKRNVISDGQKSDFIQDAINSTKIGAKGSIGYPNPSHNYEPNYSDQKNKENNENILSPVLLKRRRVSKSKDIKLFDVQDQTKSDQIMKSNITQADQNIVVEPNAIEESVPVPEQNNWGKSWNDGVDQQQQYSEDKQRDNNYSEDPRTDEVGDKKDQYSDYQQHSSSQVKPLSACACLNEQNCALEEKSGQKSQKDNKQTNSVWGLPVDVSYNNSGKSVPNNVLQKELSELGNLVTTKKKELRALEKKYRNLQAKILGVSDPFVETD